MFYEFERSSGKCFIKDNKFCRRVFIEAGSEEEAIRIAKEFSCFGNDTNIVEIDIGKYMLEGYRVSIYDNMYADTVKEWHNRYGNYEIMETPTLKIILAFPEYSGRIKFRNIEEYVQFHADEFGWNAPTDIYYRDGRIRRIWRN